MATLGKNGKNVSISLNVPSVRGKNIPLNIGKEFYIARDGSNPTLEFEFNCEDLALYCEHMCLGIAPTNHE